MFDIGWSELFVIAVVTLIAVGPREIPKVLYQVGKWVRKARSVTREFQRHVDDMVREAELEDLRKQAMEAGRFDLRKQVENTIDPGGDLRHAFDPTGTAKPAPGTAPVPASAPAPGRQSLEQALGDLGDWEDEPEADNPAFQTASPAAAPPAAAPSPGRPGGTAMPQPGATAIRSEPAAQPTSLPSPALADGEAPKKG